MACLSPPVRRIPRRRLPYSFGALGGSKEPYSVYHTPNKLSNPGECAPLDKSAQPVIMKIPKAPRQAVLPLIKLQDQVNSKPSLARVAVSACNADRYGKPKNMERDRHRHIHPPFGRQNRLSLCWSLGVQKNHIQSTISRTKCQLSPPVRAA